MGAAQWGGIAKACDVMLNSSGTPLENLPHVGERTYSQKGFDGVSDERETFQSPNMLVGHLLLGSFFYFALNRFTAFLRVDPMIVKQK